MLYSDSGINVYLKSCILCPYTKPIIISNDLCHFNTLLFPFKYPRLEPWIFKGIHDPLLNKHKAHTGIIEDETFDYEYDYGKTIRSYVKDTVTRRGLLSADGKRQMAIVYRGIVKALHADGAIDKGDKRMLLLHMRICEGEFQ